MSDPQLPDANTDATEASAQASGAVAERLVLTAALRVSDGTGVKKAPGAAAAPQPDDEALRALVREVLRQELAGPLGERLTRGVRKLVRTEVATLLLVRDGE